MKLFGDWFELEPFGKVFVIKLSVSCLEWNCLVF
jgi:hypothetical protein